MQLSVWDIVIFAAYFAAIAALGYVASRKMGGSRKRVPRAKTIDRLRGTPRVLGDFIVTLIRIIVSPRLVPTV